MANFTEPSSSLSYASSSLLSNGTSNPHDLATQTATHPSATSDPSAQTIESVSLSRLSANLEKLLVDSDFDCTDAEIIVEGSPVGIHRCILAARSKFFYDLFKDGNTPVKSDGGKVRYEMDELVKEGKVGKDALLFFLGYVYTGKVKAPPMEVSICVDPMCAHDACRPAISFVVELVYASSVFQVPELVNLFQRRLQNFVDKANVEDIIPIIKVAYHSNLSVLLEHCIQRITRSDLDNLSLEKEIPKEISDKIKTLRLNSNQPDPNSNPNSNSNSSESSKFESRIRNIHRALDSDDVELVKLLLNESAITLDDAKALHYAISYCDTKVISDLLDLGPINVNLKNERGLTALHIAAMRREPAVIVCLLDKNASVSELTLDGRNAVSICRRLTRYRDYNKRTEQGQESNKDRICIDILEREMMRNPIGVNLEDSVTSPLLADDLHMKLLYLENRVAFARLFFPAEAKVAMQIAQAEQTWEFAGVYMPDPSGKLKEVDLNETPMMRNKRLRERVDALMKTVELGRRYFPHCSQVLDRFLEDDNPDLYYLDKGTPDEQKIKRARFCELREDVRKAFSKDKAGLSSSNSNSNSSSLMSERSRKTPRK